MSSRTHLSFDGYCVRHKGLYTGGGQFKSYGQLVNPKGHYDGCPYVKIYFVPGIGYQYKE